MNGVPIWRINVLRGLYLFIAIGFGVFLLPQVIAPDPALSPTGRVVNYMLLAFWLLTLLGIRYPLQMLPVLLWEILWKTVWVAAVAYPQWQSGKMEHFTEANLSWLPLLAICIVAVPWRYVLSQYIVKRGEPWRAQRLESERGF